MKTLIAAVMLSLCAISVAKAEVVCTLVVDAETGVVRLEEGGCDRPASPASTFKVPLALMGYDAGILTGVDEPAWPYRAEYGGTRDAEKQTLTPRTWLRDSVIWYSREVVRLLGAERFAEYVAAFDYGNADVSGDPGKDNGMLRSWVTSSLQITPEQQVKFYCALLTGQLPVSAAARDSVMAVMPRFAAGQWDVSGKTGTFFERNADGTLNSARQWGWFVGWADRGDERLVFAYLIRDTKKTAGRVVPRVGGAS